jgi:hypothetical protein
MHVQQMMSTHPDVRGNTNDARLRCIEECYDCAQTCTSCADACLAEEMVKDMRQCIRLCLDCADICMAAGTMATRRTGSDERALLAAVEACRVTCGLCAEECQRHAGHHEHCRICGESCRRCEQACQEAIGSIRSVH